MNSTTFGSSTSLTVDLTVPRGEGFWSLAVQPPLLVVLVGVLFAVVVAPGLLEDLVFSTTMQPRSEVVHWLFATGFLAPRALLLAEAIVGEAVWHAALAGVPLAGLAFGMGLLLWPVMIFFTNSTMHMLAHSIWAQVMMLAGGAELALVRGQAARAAGGARRCRVALARLRAGVPVHEQNPWLFSAPRSSTTSRLDAPRRRGLPARCSPATAVARVAASASR